MNISEVVTLMQLQGGAKIVSVRFMDTPDERSDLPPQSKSARFHAQMNGGPSSSTYTYKCLTIPDVMINDLVVVETMGHFAVAVVAGIIPVSTMAGVDYDRLRHVVCRLPMTAYQEVLAAEGRAREALAMAEINDRLASVKRFMAIDHLNALQLSLAPPNAPPFTPPAPPMPADMEAALRKAAGQAGVVEPWVEGAK